MTANELAQYIDHTNLHPKSTITNIDRLCEEALHYNFRTVCVNSVFISRCRYNLNNTGVGISSVVGFPLGAMAAEAKAFEAEYAVKKGATEIDMVLHIGGLLEGRYHAVRQDILGVIGAAGGATIKVIIETALLTNDQITVACDVVKSAGANYVKTCSGFSGGGATTEHVMLMKAAVADSHVLVKASGGIKTYSDAVALIEAGASRIGTSNGVAIVTGAPVQVGQY